MIACHRRALVAAAGNGMIIRPNDDGGDDGYHR